MVLWNNSDNQRFVVDTEFDVKLISLTTNLSSMVIIYLLAILDAITAFVLATHVAFGWFSTEIVLLHAGYIILKGVIFFISDWASRMDAIVGVYMLLVAFDVFSLSWITIISVIWLLQKSVFAFIIPISKIFF